MDEVGLEGAQVMVDKLDFLGASNVKVRVRNRKC